MNLVVNMDFCHDAEMKHYLQMWNDNPAIRIIYTDDAELTQQQFSVLEIRHRIQTDIDSADAMLVIAGEWANDPQEVLHGIKAIFQPEVIGALNWQHFGLEYFMKQNSLCTPKERKKIRGIKLFDDCEIPHPLLGVRGLGWRVLKGKHYRQTLADIFSSVP